MKVRIATFNMENLFARFDFSAFADEGARKYLPPIVNLYSNFDGLDQTTFDEFKTLLSAAKVSQEDDKRQMTAQSIAQADADIICLQEVDNVQALTRFRDLYLHKTTPRRYEQVILHEGNDGRGIDVAALATADVPLSSRSHAWMTVGDLGSKQERKALARHYPIAAKLLKQPADAVFKRDCLELEVRWPGVELTLFVCHFKSMGGGREKTAAIRQVEALGVRRIIEQKFADPSAARWMVVGDLNDYRRIVKVGPRADGDGRYPETVIELDEAEPSGLDPLLADGFCVNLAERRPVTDQWTHYYAPDRHKTQLDYLLASPVLAGDIQAAPDILRAGQPFRVPNTKQLERHPRIGWDRPKASDHCPVVIELDVPGVT